MKSISRTAFYTTGLRMEDAENRRPIVGDTYAKEFMNVNISQIEFGQLWHSRVGGKI